MIKDITVIQKRGEGEIKRVVKAFILKETDSHYVYIPIRHIMLTDYKRFINLMKTGQGDLLETLRDTKLDNGMNALVVYDNIIQTQAKNAVEKTEVLTEEEGAKHTQDASQETQQPQQRSTKKPPGVKLNKDGTPRKKPGPKPKK